MQFQSGFWAVAGVGGVLILLAVLLGEPLFMIGTVGIGAGLLSYLLWFGRAVAAIRERATCDMSLPRSTVHVGTEVGLTVAASIPAQNSLERGLTLDVPPSAVGVEPDTTWLASDDDSVHVETELEWPIAGAFTVPPAVLRCRDPFGFFSVSGPLGEGTSIVVEESVDTGGGLEADVRAADLQRLPYGDIPTGQPGSGVLPLSIREYTPTDPADEIDWKASARLQEIFVREFEVERSQVFLLFLDLPPADLEWDTAFEPLEYLQAIALRSIRTAAAFEAPLGVFLVDDEGIVRGYPPRGGHVHHETLRNEILALDRNERAEADLEVGLCGDPTAHRFADSWIDDTAGTMLETLTPFVRDAASFVDRVDDRPLFSAVRAHTRSGVEATTVTIVTTANDQLQTRETIELAQSRSFRVIVFLLHPPHPTADDEGPAQSNQYTTFVRFKKQLQSMADVTVYQVPDPDDPRSVPADEYTETAS